MPDGSGVLNIEPNLNAGSPIADYAGRKRRILIASLAYAAFLGALSVLLHEHSPALNLVLGLPTLILAVMWCQADAKERDYRIGKITLLGLVLFFIVAFPIYVFRTRGLRGFKTLGLAVLFAAAMFVGALFAGVLIALIMHPGFIK